MKSLNIPPTLLAIGLVVSLASSSAQAQTIVIDDFSTGFGGLANNPVMVDGVTSVFDELSDVAPSGSIGDRHEWISGFNFQYPGVPNNLYVSDNPALPSEVLLFGGFDYNLEFGLDYTPSSGAPAFDLTSGGGNAFAIDVVFSDIPSAPMTVTVVTGSGTGSFSVNALIDDQDFSATTYLFDFASFSGTPDFSNVQSISWRFLTVNEFGPDAIFDNFEVVAAPAPLFLTAPTLTSGSTATMLVSGATPGQNVYFVYSVVGLGSTFVPALNIGLDLASPNLAGLAMANGAGDASLPSVIPNGATGLTVFIQAVQFQRKSGVELRTVL
jgi:hypothetical protein